MTPHQNPIKTVKISFSPCFNYTPLSLSFTLSFSSLSLSYAIHVDRPFSSFGRINKNSSSRILWKETLQGEKLKLSFCTFLFLKIVKLIIPFFIQQILERLLCPRQHNTLYKIGQIPTLRKLNQVRKQMVIGKYTKDNSRKI